MYTNEYEYITILIVWACKKMLFLLNPENFMPVKKRSESIIR